MLTEINESGAIVKIRIWVGSDAVRQFKALRIIWIDNFTSYPMLTIFNIYFVFYFEMFFSNLCVQDLEVMF